ncbi:hypothetical protein [Pseudobacteriovorax antillogorgiicola]|uniref:Uncharacterized protein n=1 Tax=Pseudobacteriovorax antillogorgiicola TaxID=1513793 RepID=A0A1Y6BRE5_9BACT|nr:hypothetical protein [Pseudobacteriovorax antillogorgiicola]TCS53192.1 hypothetical protein EDD56_108243 [Pseudobacteriovorax antillogorgiicola]SMF24426.1 hypothetical protein SAMN06296036_1083 [Pseudobacteriovorax antillogorgiicola]
MKSFKMLFGFMALALCLESCVTQERIIKPDDMELTLVRIPTGFEYGVSKEPQKRRLKIPEAGSELRSKLDRLVKVASFRTSCDEEVSYHRYIEVRHGDVFRRYETSNQDCGKDAMFVSGDLFDQLWGDLASYQ